MKKILTATILIFVSISVQLIVAFPWWSFLVVVFFLGVLLPLEKWKVSAFPVGFISGFIVWALSTFYFETIYDGEIIKVVSKMMSVPHLLLYIIIGLVGGIPSGLTFYSGFLLRRGREKLHLELPKN